jgi:hypothetical protein
MLGTVLVVHDASVDGALPQGGVSPISLIALRKGVVDNEAKVSLVRMEYKYFSKIGNESLPRTGSLKRRPEGRQGSHMQCVYAQDDERVHSTVSLYADKEWISGWIHVINGEVRKTARLPDLMTGRIDHIETFNWVEVGFVGLGLRPFKNKYRLSELLVPAYVSIYEDHTTIDGRDAAIVDVKNPDSPTSFSRLWIDLEKSAPLRIERYAADNTGTGCRQTSVTEKIELHQLPNGGWTPVGGISTGIRKTGGKNITRVVVDVNSISIDKKDIPDSLFDIQFPPGAKVENGIVGVVVPGDLHLESLSREVLQQMAEETLATPASTNSIEDTAAVAEIVPATPDTSGAAPDPGGVQAASSPPSWGKGWAICAAVLLMVLVFGVTGMVYSRPRRHD